LKAKGSLLSFQNIDGDGRGGAISFSLWGLESLKWQEHGDGSHASNLYKEFLDVDLITPIQWFHPKVRYPFN
jgi:hypothetical protein